MVPSASIRETPSARSPASPAAARGNPTQSLLNSANAAHTQARMLAG